MTAIESASLIHDPIKLEFWRSLSHWRSRERGQGRQAARPGVSTSDERCCPAPRHAADKTPSASHHHLRVKLFFRLVVFDILEF